MKRTFLLLVGIGLMLLALALLLGGLVQFILPESFQSIVRIIPEEPPTPAGTAADSDGKNPRWIPAQIEILQSKTVLYPVIERLNLNRGWARKYKEPGDLQTEVSYTIVKRQLVVRQIRKTNLIEVRVISENPREAALIANEIAKVYCETRAKARQTQAGTSPVASTAQIIDAAEPGLRPIRPTPAAKIGFFAGGLFWGMVGLWLLILGLRKPKSA